MDDRGQRNSTVAPGDSLLDDRVSQLDSTTDGDTTPKTTPKTRPRSISSDLGEGNSWNPTPNNVDYGGSWSTFFAQTSDNSDKGTSHDESSTPDE
eukprot:gene21480-8222_t